MITAQTSPALQPATEATPSRATLVAYWVFTLFVALAGLAAGIADLQHLQPLYGILLHLGYPPYFATLLGLWKIAGAVVLLAPRYPLVKEWAYAGMFCDYCSAIYSQLAAGDGAAAAMGAALSIGALAVSWSLRPQARRLGRS